MSSKPEAKFVKEAEIDPGANLVGKTTADRDQAPQSDLEPLSPEGEASKQIELVTQRIGTLILISELIDKMNQEQRDSFLSHLVEIDRESELEISRPVMELAQWLENEGLIGGDDEFVDKLQEFLVTEIGLDSEQVAAFLKVQDD